MSIEADFDEAIREAKEAAWDEGHTAGIAFQAGNSRPHTYTNPYKETTDE